MFSVSLQDTSFLKVLPLGLTSCLFGQIHSISNCSMLGVPSDCIGRDQLLTFFEIMPTKIFFLSYAHFSLLNLP